MTKLSICLPLIAALASVSASASLAAPTGCTAPEGGPSVCLAPPHILRDLDLTPPPEAPTDDTLPAEAARLPNPASHGLSPGLYYRLGSEVYLVDRRTGKIRAELGAILALSH